HGGFRFGNRNEEGSSILDFSIAWDLLLANTYFKKREEHLITYKSGSSVSQIDFVLTRKRDQKLCKDCKVIPGEHVTTQHRLLVLDVKINTYKQKFKAYKNLKIRWWNLKGEKKDLFRDNILKEKIWDLDGEVNKLWNEITTCIKKNAKEILGESIGMAPLGKEGWWWNEKIQKLLKEKKECYKTYYKNKNEDTLRKYKLVKKNAKKMISEVKNQTYKELYDSLDTKKGENRIYKLAKSRERKSRNISQVKCIKDENDRVLVKENEIKDRWYKYFYKLFNDSSVEHSYRQENLECNTNDLNYSFFRRITNLEVKDALRKMKCGKAIGPNGLPIEVWKCIGEVGIKWLTKFFNIIFKAKKIPD
ncbi:exonuclease/endonuclease/phosphatase family protein, partial [Vibrio parahaemolyticus]|uniref:hypothetical protein n=1 Tax=Vibrio parahaemolyticus TaxID=670 RepID=UPI00226A5C5A